MNGALDGKAELRREEAGVFRFAFIANTRLNDGEENIRKKMAEAAADGVDCLIHGGNIINGVAPERVSRRMMRDEFASYAACAPETFFLPVQGESDGWVDWRCAGQVVWNVMTDEVWGEETAFINGYPHLARKEGKPYYYIDFPEKRVRIIVLCSYFYQQDREVELFEKYRGFDIVQRRWLIEEALNAPAGYTALIVSHAIPGASFDGTTPGHRLYSTIVPIEKAAQRDVCVAGWMTGGYDQDAVEEVRSVKLISRNMRGGETFDLCSLDLTERTLSIDRFGEGEKQVIRW